MQSSKSKTILVVDGYEYYKKRENKLTTAWNCAQYQTLSCRTSAITSGEQLISIRGNHNHDICLGKVGARNVPKKIKELSEVSTPAVSVASALLEFTDEYATQLTLPSKASLFKVSRRVRQKKNLIHFPDPASQNFDVPEEFHSFLVHDTLKLIPSLAFEKLENVKSSFKLLVEDTQEVCEQLSLDSSEVEKIDELCSYFQNTCIEKNLREPLFPSSIWNKREAASESVATTTNAVEGWHFDIQAFFSSSHPSLWKTLENLKKDAATQKCISICSQHQVRIFRGEKSIENWRRR